MKTINIEKIKFENVDEKGETANYPNSGLFESELIEGSTDLVFVNKKQEHVFYICPLDVFDSFYIDKQEVTKISKQIKEPKNESIKYDGDFILEFARVLLNRK